LDFLQKTFEQFEGVNFYKDKFFLDSIQNYTNHLEQKNKE